MNFTVKTGAPGKQDAGCTVVGVFESRRKTAAADALDRASKGVLAKLLRRGDMDGKLGTTLLVPDLPGSGTERVLLVGCGRKRKLRDRDFFRIVGAAAAALARTGATDASWFLTELDVADRDTDWKVRQLISVCRQTLYRFVPEKLEAREEKRRLRRCSVIVESRGDLRSARRAAAEATAIANGVDLARELGNLPGNTCTPGYLAQRARRLARGNKRLRVRVLDEAEMRRRGMNALLAVAQGSREPAKLIILEYTGGPKTRKPVVLVGKGVTFDSGGISLKPGAAMDEMKFDMCGAASVIGCIAAAAELELDTNLVAVVPATENLPDGQAVKPGDVVKSMSGRTIEILNTDAEGRLILCDALSYAEKFDPDVVIDVATLTGACVVALGNHPSGLFTNDRGLGDALLAAGETSGDRAWELPLWEDYQEQIKSNFADVANVGGRNGGAITAACFLARFTEDYRWAHLDIAGTAWLSGARKGATGRPVPLLMQYLLDRRGAAQRGKKKKS